MNLERKRANRKRMCAVSDLHESAHGLSVDRQAWGTKRGLCWRATRDGLRHVPAGPPESRYTKDSSRIGLRDARRPAGKPRYSARTATIFLRYVSQAGPLLTSPRIAPIAQKSVSDSAPSAGAGKNAPFSSRGFFARGVLGLQLGFGVGWGFAQQIPTHQVTRGNQSRNSDC